MKKKIFINAYTGLNLGDDLFIKILCERYPSQDFYIVARLTTSAALKKIKNLHVIPGTPIIFDKILSKIGTNISLTNILKRIVLRYCDIFVHIGGSIFIEGEKWEKDINQYKKLVKYKKPLFIIGSNFGPFKDYNFVDAYEKIFMEAKDICFREKNSFQLFESVPNVRYAPDVVFSYKCKNNYKIKVKRQIIISVINIEKRKDLMEYSKTYILKILNIAKKFSDEGYKVILMSFCETEGDRKVIEKILSQLNENERKNIIPYYYEGNLEEALKKINQSSYIIASRFHSMILGWIFNKPVFPLLYSKKMYNVIKDINFNGNYSWIKDMETLDANQLYDDLVKEKPVNIEKEVFLSQKQFLNLDDILNKK